MYFYGKVTMYADDTSLSNEGKTIEDIKTKLMPDLSRICNWLRINKLNLDVIKTEFMFMGTRKNTLKILEYINHQGGWKLI